jgi:hypothetical protein
MTKTDWRYVYTEATQEERDEITLLLLERVATPHFVERRKANYLAYWIGGDRRKRAYTKHPMFVVIPVSLLLFTALYFDAEPQTALIFSTVCGLLAMLFLYTYAILNFKPRANTKRVKT